MDYAELICIGYGWCEGSTLGCYPSPEKTVCCICYFSRYHWLFFISAGETYISNAETCISKAEIYISKAEI